MRDQESDPTMNYQLRLRLPSLGLLAMLVAGCGSNTGGGGGGGTNDATVKGLVTSATGAALYGVNVRSAGSSTTSGADGRYTLSVSPGANQRIAASLTGSVETFEVISLAANQVVPLDFSLLSIGQRASLTGLLTTPALVTEPRGAEVTLAANTVVDNSGAAVDAATVELTAGLPSDPDYVASFPGLFIGDVAGVEAAIESFGFVTIELSSQTGQPCNLRPGALADIAIPVAPGADPGTPTIDLWSLNEATGTWALVGQAARDGSGAPTVYRAQVSHFSSYNLDRRIEGSVAVKVDVQNAVGGQVAGASVVITSTNQTDGAQWEGRGVTGADGTLDFPTVPRSDSARVDVLSGSQVGSGDFDLVNVQDGFTERVIVTVHTVVSRTFTIVYLNNGVQTPIPNQAIQVFQMDGNVGIRAAGTTNGQGQVTLSLEEGHGRYTYDAHTGSIGGQFYAIDGNVSTLAEVPATWVLTP